MIKQLQYTTANTVELSSIKEVTKNHRGVDLLKNWLTLRENCHFVGDRNL